VRSARTSEDAAVLGVATFDYFPYCYFNLINPVLSLIYGFLGFRMVKFDDFSSDADPVAAGAPIQGGN
jgi:Na+:H+ antiporter, NhaC family